MKRIHTEIEINASAQSVWDALMDFKSYADWNPFIKSIAGDSKFGGTLDVLIQPQGQSAMRFTPTVTEYAPRQAFGWQGHLGIRGIFDGNHFFHLQSLAGNRTKLIHGENFSGLLVPLLLRLIGKSTQQSFEAMNIALKNKLETS